MREGLGQRVFLEIYPLACLLPFWARCDAWAALGWRAGPETTTFLCLEEREGASLPQLFDTAAAHGFNIQKASSGRGGSRWMQKWMDGRMDGWHRARSPSDAPSSSSSSFLCASCSSPLSCSTRTGDQRTFTSTSCGKSPRRETRDGMDLTQSPDTAPDMASSLPGV
jgi:hypothetical protein